MQFKKWFDGSKVVDKSSESLLADTADVAEDSQIYIFDGDESQLVESKKGEAIRVLREGNKVIPIAEGFDFDKTGDMKKAMHEYISLLNDEHFNIKEDKTDVYFDKDSAKEYAYSDNTDLLKKKTFKTV